MEAPAATGIDLNHVLRQPPRLHNFGVNLWGLNEHALRFIHAHTERSHCTLETGCGLSTIIFALKGSRHTVIAPAPDEFELTRQYCRDNNIPTEQITFVTETSQKVLPTLDGPPLDLVLIDGGHGFPTPYIDWFYASGRLKTGGYMIIDDVGLWTCGHLREFLIEQKQHWEFIEEYDGRTAVFRKVRDGSEWLEWTQQPKVASGGRMRYINGRLESDIQWVPALRDALDNLLHGDFSTLGKKIAGRIRRN